MRRFTAALCVCALFCAAGCARHQTHPTPLAKPAAAPKAAKPAKKSALSSIAANAEKPRLTFTDPKTGKILWKAQAQSLSAQSSATGSGIIGKMLGVTGVLYQNGAPADRITADTVQADQGKETVTADGHVSVQTIAIPPTSVRCDHLIFYAAQNKLLGTGNVIFQKDGFKQTGGSFQADTKMKKLVMPAPQYGGKITATLTPKFR